MSKGGRAGGESGAGEEAKEALCLGGDGVVPWQTIGTASSWTGADRLALLYPPQGGGEGDPIRSLR